MIPKFRAWHKELERMMSVQTIWLDEGEVSELELDDSFINESILVYRDEVALMQSTGLVDKNGDDIFEGDVVEVFDSRYTVFYDSENASFRLNPRDKRWNTDYMSNYAHEASFEIAGNIYEHNRLLK
jgi:uncharacterized phage protein (TIGR01671 family)